MIEASGHYESTETQYFQWQSEIGRFGGWANLMKFAPYIEPHFKVIDFGCGGGYLLERIQCREKRGIEVASAARAESRRRGIDVVASTAEIPDNWADVIISNSALEHCLHPLRELQALRGKLAPGGRIVFVVPCESIGSAYKPGDINHHLYTWSPMNLGNLFTEAGYEIDECKRHLHVWPPRVYRLIARCGRTVFEAACRVYGRLSYWGLTPTKVSHVRIVARRPA